MEYPKLLTFPFLVQENIWKLLNFLPDVFTKTMLSFLSSLKLFGQVDLVVTV
jgi:hypothetical protein